VFGTCIWTTERNKVCSWLDAKQASNQKEDRQSGHLTNQPAVLHSWRWWLFVTCHWWWHMGASPQSRGERWNPGYRSILQRLQQRSLRQLWAWGRQWQQSWDITESVLFISCRMVWQWLQCHIRPCYNALSSSTPEAQPVYPSTSRARKISYAVKRLNKFSGRGVQMYPCALLVSTYLHLPNRGETLFLT